MPRPSKSQWDFGELFSPEQMRRVWSVSEVTGKVRSLIESQIGEVWVTGEVSNLRAQASGHIYFTLKDASSQLACVLFRNERVPQRNLLQDGTSAILRGGLTVYEARGQYQLIVREVELKGVGALQAAFEQLKRKLAAEGLFDEDRKQAIPHFAERVGVVTSPTAAALRDVIHVIERRNPALEVLLAPCRVQGDEAAGEIAAAIRALNDFHAVDSRGLDAILLTRGGGSLEDLWAFNEEIVARAIADSALPVVSAVGHEIDFTISDFAADLRAATPSAAAEILTEGVYAATEFVFQAPDILGDCVRRDLKARSEDVDQRLARLGRCHPRRQLDEFSQRLDDAVFDLQRGVVREVRRSTLEWQHLSERLFRLRPSDRFRIQNEALAQATARLSELQQRSLEAKAERLAALRSQLKLLGPEQVLARGYSITMDEATGKVIRDAATVTAGQTLRTRLHRGEIRSRVQE